MEQEAEMNHKRLMRLRWNLCQRARDAELRSHRSGRLDVSLRAAGMATAYRRAADAIREVANGSS